MAITDWLKTIDTWVTGLLSFLAWQAMQRVCHQRGLAEWNRLVVPDLDVASQRRFEHELSKVGMRAGLAIPEVFANGYAYGLACHQLIAGRSVLLR